MLGTGPSLAIRRGVDLPEPPMLSAEDSKDKLSPLRVSPTGATNRLPSLDGTPTTTASQPTSFKGKALGILSTVQTDDHLEHASDYENDPTTVIGAEVLVGLLQQGKKHNRGIADDIFRWKMKNFGQFNNRKQAAAVQQLKPHPPPALEPGPPGQAWAKRPSDGLEEDTSRVAPRSEMSTSTMGKVIRWNRTFQDRRKAEAEVVKAQTARRRALLEQRRREEEQQLAKERADKEWEWRNRHMQLKGKMGEVLAAKERRKAAEEAVVRRQLQEQRRAVREAEKRRLSRQAQIKRELATWKEAQRRGVEDEEDFFTESALSAVRTGGQFTEWMKLGLHKHHVMDKFLPYIQQTGIALY